MNSWEIKQKSLEKLKVAARLNDNGLSNFKLIENKDGEEHFVFRVVCEKLHIAKGIVKEINIAEQGKDD